jgi:hypothetical protein
MTGTDDGPPTSPSTTTLRAWADTVVRAAHTSWALTVTPLTREQAWAESTVDPTRIPQVPGAHRAETLWNLSNWSDRLILALPLLLLSLASRSIPAAARIAGAGWWTLARPTRRYGFYLLAIPAILTFLAAIGVL